MRNQHDWFTARRREFAKERPLPTSTVIALDPPKEGVKTPSVSVARHEEEAWVRLALELLNPDDKEVLILRQWDKLSFKEIGERLGIEANAARMRTSRALRRLTDEITKLRNSQF